MFVCPVCFGWFYCWLVVFGLNLALVLDWYFDFMFNSSYLVVLFILVCY